MPASLCLSVAFFLLAAYFIPYTQGAHREHHVEESLPDELGLMELYLTEPSSIAVKRAEGKNDRPRAGTPQFLYGPSAGRRKRSIPGVLTMNDFKLAQEEVFLKGLQDGPFAGLSLRGAHRVHNVDEGLPDEFDLTELYLADNPTTVLKRAEGKEDKTKEVSSRLWFGPRLGRRKRAYLSGLRIKGEDNELNLAQEEAILKLLQDGPFAVFTVRGGKRRSVNFTPRLGRDSEETLLENFVEPGLGSYSRAPTRPGSQIASNVQSMSNFTPRLGRLAPTANEQH